MKIVTSFLAALLLAGSLVASATAVYAEDEGSDWQTRIREMRKFKYEYAQD
jgi:hypothetical protein